MKKSVIPFLLLLLLWSCGVPKHTKDLLNVSFRNTLRDLYGEQGIYITDVISEVVSMEYCKEGCDYYKSKEPGYQGTIKCKFRDGNTTISMWFDVGFDKYWHVQKLPEIYGKDKVDVYVSDILVSEIADYKDAIKSPYILDRFCSLNDSKNAINFIRKKEGKEPLQ